LARKDRTAYHYGELAEAIHTTIRIITTGADVLGSIQDLADELRVDAREIPNPDLAEINRRWADRIDYLTGATT